MAKTAQFTLLTLRFDPQGRFIFLHARINGLELLLLAVYIPPPFQFTVLTEGLSFMSQVPTVPALWLVDFNNVVDGDLDRLTLTSPDNPSHQHMRFGKFLNELALIDTWRHCHPQAKTFSCFSATHNSMSRIDLILISRSLLPMLRDVGFSPRILSDHAPYWAEFKIYPPTWKLNPFWLSVVLGIEEIGGGVGQFLSN